MTTPALFGLVLAGGASTRMGADKAALQYHGQPQLRWAFELASQVCAATFVSVRPDQRDDATRASFPQIVDRQPGIGPIAGISAALLEHPKAAWLVLACDLPFLTERTLQHLMAHRDAHKIATAYRSSHDGLPEPLCAIWEPAAREPLLAYIATGKQCPRKFLINSNTALLDLPERQALDNVNTVEEFGLATAALGPRTKTAKTIRVQYYAILREQAGRSDETLDTSAGTPAELYAELRKRHPFQLGAAQLKVALNSEFSDWQTPLKHGDTVVFIPPVAGG
jgi:molybdopterin-guanine dinucleotide biosynthesis protein A